jgi:hypothetical protein
MANTPKLYGFRYNLDGRRYSFAVFAHSVAAAKAAVAEAEFLTDLVAEMPDLPLRDAADELYRASSSPVFEVGAEGELPRVKA